MKFYVIGNGFDLHYGLKTSYHNFKSFLLNSSSYEVRDIVDKMDELFYNFWDSNDIEKWSKFEDMLSVFNQIDPQDLLDEAFANAETDMDRASYTDDPAWCVQYYNDYIHVLKSKFELWIQTIDDNITPDAFFNPSKNDWILSFNYTKTVEHNFNVMHDRILHIHGTIGTPLILGHNDFQEPSLLPAIWDIDSDIRNVKACEAVNDIMEDISTLYYKNSGTIIEKSNDFFENISQSERIIIMGLSCGQQDSAYISKILSYGKPVDFFYYSPSDIDNFENYLDSFKGEIKYYSW